MQVLKLIVLKLCKYWKYENFGTSSEVHVSFYCYGKTFAEVYRKINEGKRKEKGRQNIEQINEGKNKGFACVLCIPGVSMTPPLYISHFTDRISIKFGA
jgi:hypothetical protein